MLTEGQINEFAERGFVVIPQVVPAGVLDRANRRIDEITAADPPPEDTRGSHFYFPETKDEPALGEPLTGGPAFGLAHYLLGHNIGGNFESERTRRALYYRLSAAGHAGHREEFLRDPWLEIRHCPPGGCSRGRR